MNKKIIIFIFLSIVISFTVLYFYKDKGLLYGKIILYNGNCMPGASGCKTSSVSRTIYIREPVLMGAMEATHLKEKNNLVKQIKSDDDGKYKIVLPVGTYSVFVEDGDKEYCNLFGDQGKVCQVVVKNGIVKYNIEIDHAVW